MENLIPSLYYSYGKYVTEKKMLPNSIDGTIPVWKRLLLSCHILARNEFVKTTEVTAYCMGHFHPYADSFGVAETLVQNGFIIGKGNWGSNLGIEPIGAAAPRYTGMRMNPIVEEVCFKYINDVPWEPDEVKPEPVFLPTMIPVCLFSENEFNMIAFGFKTVIPNYTLKDLINRLLFLLDQRRRITIKPNITGCDITSSNDELEKILTTPGKQTINVKGRYTEDKKNFIVYINGWPPRTSFQNIFNKIDNHKDKKGTPSKLFSNGDITYIDESTEKDGTKIRLEVARARNREKIYDRLLTAVKSCLKSSLYYNIFVFTPDKGVEEMSVDQLLLSCYNHYREILNIHLQNKLQTIESSIKELDLIEAIKPHISKITDKNKTEEELILELSNLVGADIADVSEIINKYKIRKLLSVNTDKQKLLEDKKWTKDKLKDVDKYSIDNYNDLLKNLK